MEVYLYSLYTHSWRWQGKVYLLKYLCVTRVFFCGLSFPPKNYPSVNLLMHTSVMGPQGLGLSGLWGRLDGDGGGDCGGGDGDLANAVGPKPENRHKTTTQ